MNDNPNPAQTSEAPPEPKPNGHLPGQVMPTRQQFEEMLDANIGAVFSCYLRGYASTMPQIPSHVVMLAACRAMGKIVGSTYAGLNAPLGPLLTARKECKDAFDKVITAIKVTGPGGANSPPPQPPVK